MLTVVLLLGAVNVGRRQMAMADVRGLLGDAGYANVRTHLASGNVLVDADSATAPDAVAADVQARLEAHFGFAVLVLPRTADDLRAVVAADPFAGVADNPSKQAVAFLSGPPDAGALAALTEQDFGAERIVAGACELHLWHPDGLGRSPLGAALGKAKLGVTMTVRNWRTTTKLLELASS